MFVRGYVHGDPQMRHRDGTPVTGVLVETPSEVFDPSTKQWVPGTSQFTYCTAEGELARRMKGLRDGTRVITHGHFRIDGAFVFLETQEIAAALCDDISPTSRASVAGQSEMFVRGYVHGDPETRLHEGRPVSRVLVETPSEVIDRATGRWVPGPSQFTYCTAVGRLAHRMRGLRDRTHVIICGSLRGAEDTFVFLDAKEVAATLCDDITPISASEEKAALTAPAPSTPRPMPTPALKWDTPPVHAPSMPATATGPDWLFHLCASRRTQAWSR